MAEKKDPPVLESKCQATRERRNTFNRWTIGLLVAALTAASMLSGRVFMAHAQNDRSQDISISRIEKGLSRLERIEDKVDEMLSLLIPQKP